MLPSWANSVEHSHGFFRSVTIMVLPCCPILASAQARERILRPDDIPGVTSEVCPLCLQPPSNLSDVPKDFCMWVNRGAAKVWQEWANAALSKRSIFASCCNMFQVSSWNSLKFACKWLCWARENGPLCARKSSRRYGFKQCRWNWRRGL